MTNDEFKRKRIVDLMKNRDGDSDKRQRCENTIPKEKQFEYIKELKNMASNEIKKCYLLSISWYLSFQQYCKGELDVLSSIDNSLLFDQEKSKLKVGLVRGKDYMLLPEKAWNCLVGWYGVKEEYVVVKKKYSFQVYQLHEKPRLSQTLYLHYGSTVKDFYKALITALRITSSIVHVWLLSQPIQSDVFITEPLLNAICVKEIDPLMLSTEACLSQYLPTDEKERYYLAIKTSGKAKMFLRGLRGLKNLGNTCYMNSAIQCLSNTPLLTQWFLRDMYKEDINRSNPLGLEGQLANSYADLIKSIWSKNNITVSPFTFKKTFEKFNSHFNGYEQQDSQEFLGFLLDGLHEDMNRISNKPYIEIPDFEDESKEKEIANHFWEYHKARNDSIIVDLFQGQFKSKLICNQCEKVSITFDPFMYLSLPIPISNCKLNITFIHYSSPSQIKFTLYLNKNSTISDLKQEIKEKLDAKHFLITQLSQQKISRIFKGDEPLSDIYPMDIIYVYEIPCSLNDTDHWVIFPFYHSLLDQDGNHHSTFGHPLVLALNKSKERIDPSACIIQHIQRYTKKNLQEEQPMFTPRLFNSKNTKDSTFPVLCSFEDIDLQIDQDPYTVQQGQGMLIEWAMTNAFDIFGSVPKKNSTTRIVNTELWKKFTVLPTVHPKQEDITLADCLGEFTKEEQLSKDDLWYCPRCKLQQRATKKFDLWKLPEIVVIHLKRFNQVRMWGNKVNAYVDFPVSELDMTSYVLGPKENPLIYDLYAIDNHFGGLEGGHYTACTQNVQDRNWYNFDDMSVTKMDLSRIKTNAAYLLFYRRR